MRPTTWKTETRYWLVGSRGQPGIDFYPYESSFKLVKA